MRWTSDAVYVAAYIEFFNKINEKKLFSVFLLVAAGF